MLGLKVCDLHGAVDQTQELCTSETMAVPMTVPLSPFSVVCQLQGYRAVLVPKAHSQVPLAYGSSLYDYV